VTALRDTARRSKGYVGEAVLFSSLPKLAVPSPSVTTGEVDYRRQAASLFLSERARTGDQTIYMPAIINPLVQIVGLKIYPGAATGPPKKPEGFPG
jgi:hypothetical protein